MISPWNHVAGTSTYIFLSVLVALVSVLMMGHEEQPMRAGKKIKQQASTKQEKAKNDAINFLGAKRGGILKLSSF